MSSIFAAEKSAGKKIALSPETLDGLVKARGPAPRTALQKDALHIKDIDCDEHILGKKLCSGLLKPLEESLSAVKYQQLRE